MPSYEYIGVRAIMAGLSQFRSDINAYNAIVRTAGTATDAFAKASQDSSKLTQASLTAQAKAASDSYGTIIGQAELAIESAQVYANAIAKSEEERLAAVQSAADAAIAAREKEAESFIAAAAQQVAAMKDLEKAALSEAETVIKAKADELAAAETAARSMRAIVAAPVTAGQLAAGVASNGQPIGTAEVTAANVAVAQLRKEYADLISEQAIYVDSVRTAANDTVDSYIREADAQGTLTAATRIATTEIVKDAAEQSAAVKASTDAQTAAAEENLARQTQIAAAQKYIAANAAEAGVAGAGIGISSGVALGGALVATAAFAAATKVASTYEDALKQTQVQAGATDAEIQTLSKSIQTIASTSRTGSIEIANMAKDMAASGVTTEQLSSSVLKAAVDLKNASAGFLSSAQAADLMTNVLSQFQISAGQAGQVADTLVAVSAKSRANFEDIAVALRNSGQAAHAYGLSIGETTALLGLFADAGLKGASGGTALVQMFRQLDNATSTAQPIIDKYNLGLKDIEGNLRPLPSILASFKAVLDGTAVGTENLTQAQRNSLLEQVGNTRAYRAFLAMAEQGPEVFKAYVTSITESGTTTTKAGDAATTAAGQFDILKSNLSNLAITAGSQTTGPLKGLIQILNDAAKGWGEIFSGVTGDKLKALNDAVAAGKKAQEAVPTPSPFAGPDAFQAFQQQRATAYNDAYNDSLAQSKVALDAAKLSIDDKANADTIAASAANEAALADNVAAAATEKRSQAAKDFLKAMQELGPGGTSLQSFLDQETTNANSILKKLNEPRPLAASTPLAEQATTPESIQQARADIGTAVDDFTNTCENFVDDLEGIQDRTGRASAQSAADMFKAQGLLRTDLNNITIGSRVYLSDPRTGLGHVGLFTGGASGQDFISKSSLGIIEESLTKWAHDTGQTILGFVNNQSQGANAPSPSFPTGRNGAEGIAAQATAYTKQQAAAKSLGEEIKRVDDVATRYDQDAGKLATDYVTAYHDIEVASQKATDQNKVQTDKRASDIRTQYVVELTAARASYAQQTADAKVAYDQQTADAKKAHDQQTADAALAFKQQSADRLADFNAQKADTLAQRAFDEQIKKETDAFNATESQKQIDLTNAAATGKVDTKYTQDSAAIQTALNAKLAVAKTDQQRKLLQVQAQLQQEALDTQHKKDLADLQQQQQDAVASAAIQKQIQTETDAFNATEQAKSLAFQDAQTQASFDRQTAQAQQAYDRQVAASQQAFDRQQEAAAEAFNRQQAKAKETLDRQLQNYADEEQASLAKNVQEGKDRQDVIDANDKIEKDKLILKLNEQSDLLKTHLTDDLNAMKQNDDAVIAEEKRVQAAFDAAIAAARNAASHQSGLAIGAPPAGTATQSGGNPGDPFSFGFTLDTGGVAGFGPFGSHIPALLQPDETVLKPTQLMSLINNVSNATTRNVMQNFTYQVNASYANKQSPASIKLDLQAMVAASR